MRLRRSDRNRWPPRKISYDAKMTFAPILALALSVHRGPEDLSPIRDLVEGNTQTHWTTKRNSFQTTLNPDPNKLYQYCSVTNPTETLV